MPRTFNTRAIQVEHGKRNGNACDKGLGIIFSEIPDTKVEEIANSFREHQIPCDAIYLDIDYMDKYKCFTWHPENFPDPKALVNSLKSKGFKTVIIIDPGIKIEKGYPIYDEQQT